MVDIVLAKGGNEAVVESFYIVMKAQLTGSRMANGTLTDRTIVDWVYPSPNLCPSTIDAVADIHSKGDPEFGISAHHPPIHMDIRNRSVYKDESKVMQKLSNRKIKLPFLMHPDDQKPCPKS